MTGNAFSAQTGEQLKKLEEALLSDAVRKDPQELHFLLADEFRELGASGQRWSKAEIISELLTAPPARGRLESFEVYPLSGEAALVTYRAVSETEGSPPMESLRSSIWVRRDDRWQMLFHQGTLTRSESGR